MRVLCICHFLVSQSDCDPSIESIVRCLKLIVAAAVRMGIVRFAYLEGVQLWLGSIGVVQG